METSPTDDGRGITRSSSERQNWLRAEWEDGAAITGGYGTVCEGFATGSGRRRGFGERSCGGG